MMDREELREMLDYKKGVQTYEQWCKAWMCSKNL